MLGFLNKPILDPGLDIAEAGRIRTCPGRSRNSDCSRAESADKRDNDMQVDIQEALPS